MAEKRMRRRRPPLDIRAAVRNWLLNDDAATKFGKAKEEARGLILGFLDTEGEVDEKGNRWIRFEEDPVEGRVSAIKAEKRTSRRLNQERAEEFLKGRRLYSKCTETVTILSEEKVLALAWNETITEEELQKLYDVTETTAFVPQRVKA